MKKLNILILILLTLILVQPINVEASRLREMNVAGVVSTSNTTIVALGSGLTFTGTGEQNNHPQVGVMVKTDNTGTMFFDFSNDGSNWDSVFPTDGFNVAANISEFHTAVKLGRFFRVRFVNDTGAQSFMRLTTYFGSSFVPSVLPIEQEASTDQDTIAVRPLTSFDLDQARRHIAGQRAFFFFGHNLDVGLTYEDIHPNGGDINWLTTAGKIEVLSSDAADTSAGAGVRSVEIHGLSATGVDQDEVIVMNGTSAVESSLDYIRVNLVHNETVGTYGGSHQGDITVRVTGAGAILSMMTGDEGAVDTSVQYGYGEAQNGYISVPLGKVLYITRLEVIPNVGTNKSVSVALYEREGILNTSAPFDPRRVVWSAEGFDQPIEKEFKSHIKIKGLTDLFFRGLGSAASKIEVELDFYLVDANADGA